MLNDFTKQLEKDVLPKLDEMEIQTRSAVDDCEQKREKVKEEVNAFREEIEKNVDETSDSLIDAMDRPKSDLNGSLSDIDRQRQKINDLIISCTHKVREGKLYIIEYMPPTPTSLLPTLTPPVSSTPVFTPMRKVLDVIRNKLGTITYERKFSNQKDELSAVAQLSPLSPKFNKSKLNIKKMASFQCQIPVISITTAGNNTAWMMYDGSDTMYLYNDSGKVVRSITVMEGVGIWDMVVTPSGEMIVTNRDKKVRCVSVSGKVSTQIDTAPYHAVGLCLTDRGGIVVCMNGQSERIHVVVYSSDGKKKVREIRCQDDQGKQLFNYPYRVVQSSEDLCVVNTGRNVVCLYERCGVRWMYDGTQAKLEKSFNPFGICRDKYQNLLVTDLNNPLLLQFDTILYNIPHPTSTSFQSNPILSYPHFQSNPILHPQSFDENVIDLDIFAYCK